MDTVPQEAFGELLKRYRHAAGLTQEELADRAGISADTISNIERGLPHVPRKDTLQLLATALHLAPQERDGLLAAAHEAQAASRGERRPRSTSNDTGATPSPIPLQLTPLVGREDDLAAVQRLLLDPQVRLLTITGVGGVGKTRLAFALALETATAFDDGVFVIYLAPLRDPSLLPATVAGALGLREAGAMPFTEMLKRYLHERSLLLLFDNSEHLLPAAPFVADLLAACARLKVLVTSRSPLHLRGEHEYPLAPLALPSTTDAVSTEQLSAVPAVDLFAQRVHAIRPDFVLDASNVGTVAAICQRLDGLPLAIELAAARSKMFSPEALLTRLDAARLPLLAHGPRDLPARQRTLRETLAWSYDLLAPGAQAVFRRLAVFAGGCQLDAAEAICGPTVWPSFEAETTFDILATLVDHSLLRSRPAEHGDELRFFMLETVREFGWERLNAAGEQEAIQRAHASWYLKLAEQAEAAMRGNERNWQERLDDERDNVRAALTWTLHGGDLAIGLQLAAALWSHWSTLGRFAEGRQWLEAMLNTAERQIPHLDDAEELGDQMAAIIAKTLYAIGALARMQGDLDAARAVYQRSLVLREQLGDRRQIAYLLSGMGAVEEQAGNTPLALTLLEQSLAIKRQLGDQHGMVTSLTGLGLHYLMQNNFDKAAAASEECIVIADTLGNATNLAWGKSILAQVYMHRGEVEQANTLALESLALRRKLGDRRGISNSLGILGEIKQRSGDIAGAFDLYQQVLDIAHEIGVMQAILEALAAISSVYRDWQRFADGVRLLAATNAIRRASAIGTHPGPEEQERGIIDDLRAALEPLEFAEAWAEGETMTLEQVIALVHQPVILPVAILLPTRRASSE